MAIGQANHAAALAAAETERETILARLRREQDAERGRVKKALAELKRSLDRCAKHGMPVPLRQALKPSCHPVKLWPFGTQPS